MENASDYTNLLHKQNIYHLNFIGSEIKACLFSALTCSLFTLLDEAVVAEVVLGAVAQLILGIAESPASERGVTLGNVSAVLASDGIDLQESRILLLGRGTPDTTRVNDLLRVALSPQREFNL